MQDLLAIVIVLGSAFLLVMQIRAQLRSQQCGCGKGSCSAKSDENTIRAKPLVQIGDLKPRA